MARTDMTAYRVMADGYRLPIDRPDLANIGDLWARGFSVFPVVYGTKTPAIPSWAEYQHRSPTFDELAEWFGSSRRLNVAVVTGKVSGLFVLDIDSDAALAWANEHLPPCNMRVRTAKGVHLYFPYSGDLRVRNKVRTKFQGEHLDIDVRGDGGYVVGPGSVHRSGLVYAREGEGW
jgi:putative DNA primase/helicase